MVHSCVRESQRRSLATNRRAFSLLEVLLANSLLIIGISGMTTAMSTISALLSRSHKSATAIRVAEQISEHIATLPRNDPTLAPLATWTHTGAGGWLLFDRAGVAVPAGSSAEFQAHLRVLDAADDLIPGARRVDVHVHWAPAFARPLSSCGGKAEAAVLTQHIVVSP